MTATTISSRTTDVTGYIASYLIPFIPSGDLDIRDLLALALLMLMLGSIYVNSNLLYVNPMFHVLGYRLIEVSTEVGQPIMMITKQAEHPGRMLAREISQNFMILDRPNGGISNAGKVGDS